MFELIREHDEIICYTKALNSKINPGPGGIGISFFGKFDENGKT